MADLTRLIRDDVTQERSGVRHLELSQRHREWGVDCPATDIDCLVEIARGVPVAIIEYKRDTADLEQSLQSWRSLWILADKAKIAFFLAVWSRSAGEYSFRIERANNRGVELIRENRGIDRQDEAMSEREYVRFLYLIRDRDPRAVDQLPIFKGNP